MYVKFAVLRVYLIFLALMCSMRLFCSWRLQMIEWEEKRNREAEARAEQREQVRNMFRAESPR